jgi:hypothetical protein
MWGCTNMKMIETLKELKQRQISAVVVYVEKEGKYITVSIPVRGNS